MSFFLIIPLLFTGVILQSWLPAPKFFGSIEWPILTGIVIFIALRSTQKRGLCAAVLAGLLYDSFSPVPLGISILFFGLLGYGVSLLKEMVVVDQIITYFILGTVAVFAKTVYFTIVFTISGLRPLQLNYLPARLLGSLFFGVFAIPLICAVLYFIYRSIPKRRKQVWS